MAHVFCNQCGHRNTSDSVFCSSCGALLDRPADQTITLAKEWRARGGSVDLRVYRFAEHMIGGVRFYRDALRHFEAAVQRLGA